MTKIGGYSVGDKFQCVEYFLTVTFTLVRIHIELVDGKEDVTYLLQEDYDDCLNAFDKSELDEMVLIS